MTHQPTPCLLACPPGHGARVAGWPEEGVRGVPPADDRCAPVGQSQAEERWSICVLPLPALPQRVELNAFLSCVHLSSAPSSVKAR